MRTVDRAELEALQDDVRSLADCVGNLAAYLIGDSHQREGNEGAGPENRSHLRDIQETAARIEKALGRLER